MAAAITSNLLLADALGNVRLAKRSGGLNKASVVNVSQLLTLDKQFLTDKAGKLSEKLVAEEDNGLRLVLAL